MKIFFRLNVIVIFFIYVSCEKDSETIDSETQEINKFIVENMEAIYYWNSTMPSVNYLAEGDTYELFEELLTASYDEELDRNIDLWSFITDDYQELMDLFSGIKKTMGHSIRLFRISNDNEDIVGFIEYVEPGSPAEQAGLKRGDMFFEIDEETLTISNYSTLLDQETYSMTLGRFNPDFGLARIAPPFSLSAVETQINPIHLSKVILHGGKKIGYIVYTSFIENYNDELESVIADFKSQGVTELVLDLRYNSGGSIASTVLLSNMLVPESAIGDIFIKSDYNELLEEYLKTKYPEKEEFAYRLESHTNNLNLEEIVVLSSFKTASASEMIIYGLSPHMEVYHIGEQTAGKYYGSTTISDPEEKHNWAIQPIMMRAENKDNSIDYRQGLLPDLDRVDFVDAAEYYDLGDPREDFLAQALYYLTGDMPAGASLKSANRTLVPINTEDKFSNPLDFSMYYTASQYQNQ